MNLEIILEKLISIKPEWKNGDNIKIIQITGGLSNLIFKICSNNLNTVLVRFYGKSSNNLIDRETEIEIFKFVSENNMGPKLLGLFDNGRFEEYFESIPLNKDTIIQFKSQIIDKIKKINKLPYNGELICWNRLFKWNKIVSNKNVDDFSKDLNILKTKINTFPQNHYMLKKVFCHNDLVSENILLDKNNNIHIIDYEYAGNNYFGLEISNHIIYYNFENTSVDNIEIIKFLREYNKTEPSKIDLEILDYFINLTYLTWLLWALITKDNREIEYDYKKFIEICKANYKIKN